MSSVYSNVGARGLAARPGRLIPGGRRRVPVPTPEEPGNSVRSRRPARVWRDSDAVASRLSWSRKPDRKYESKAPKRTYVARDRDGCRVWVSKAAGRVWRYTVENTLPAGTLYMTTEEAKTFGFDFANHGAVMDGETLSAPVVEIDPAGPTLGTPAVIGTDFFDSDGRKILAGKGVKCRISNADAGVYSVACRVTTSGGDTLEVFAKLDVKNTV